jgi:hypothetical protein
MDESSGCRWSSGIKNIRSFTGAPQIVVQVAHKYGVAEKLLNGLQHDQFTSVSVLSRSKIAHIRSAKGEELNCF